MPASQVEVYVKGSSQHPNNPIPYPPCNELPVNVQSISKPNVLKLATQFEDIEDRAKVLRIVYEEFYREYSSSARIKRS